MTACAEGSAPRIETPRLVLRGHRIDDLDAYAGLWADPVVTRYIGGRPLPREEAWVRILRYAGMWRLLGLGFWAIEERETGRLVGEAGFHELRREIVPAFEGTPESGWMLHPSVHGRGYAREAVAACHVWSDRHLACPSTVCIIDPGNQASLKLAAIVGYLVETRTAYRGADSLVLRRLRPSAR